MQGYFSDTNLGSGKLFANVSTECFSHHGESEEYLAHQCFGVTTITAN